jgi:hypothetical protein
MLKRAFSIFILRAQLRKIKDGILSLIAAIAGALQMLSPVCRAMTSVEFFQTGL